MDLKSQSSTDITAAPQDPLFSFGVMKRINPSKSPAAWAVFLSLFYDSKLCFWRCSPEFARAGETLDCSLVLAHHKRRR